MNILFLSRWFPYPADNGSKKRVFNLLKILSRKHAVDLISFTAEEVSPERKQGLAAICRSVETVQFRDYDPQGWRARLGFFSPLPRFLFDTYRKAFHEAVWSACQSRQYDLVITSQVDMTPYTKGIGQVKVLADEIELAIYQEARIKNTGRWQKMRAELTWWKHARYVESVLSRSAAATVVSDRERQYISQLRHGNCRIEVVPNGIEMDYYQGDWGAPQPDTLIYAGALTYFANLDAMVYFITEILPLIKKERPAVKLMITGKITAEVQKKLPADPNVEFTGYLDDVRPKIGRAWLSVIPLRIGGGTRLKILESLAIGTPVISTSKGVEGLALEAGRDLLIKDSPPDFAAAVLEVLKNQELRDRLGRQGRQTVGRRYDWNLIGERFLELLDEMTGESQVTNGEI